MAIVDIVILVFVLAMAIFGFVKGFFKSFVSLLGFVLSLVLAVLLSKVVAGALLSVDRIAEWVAGTKSLYSWLYTKLPSSLEAITTQDIKLAENIKELFSEEAPWFLRMFYPLVSSGLSNQLYLDTLGNARQIMALELAYGIYVFIVGIVLFIAFRIIAEAISLVFSKYSKGPKLFYGRVLGAILGICKGIIYSMVILTILSFLVNFSFMAQVNDEIEKSKIAGILSDASIKITSTLLESNEDDPRYARLLEVAGFN